MKSYIAKILVLSAAMCLTLAFFAGCKDSGSKKVPNASDTSTPAKYGNVDVYENADGNKSAKTESGEEVELTGESMAELYAQYEKVRGTGSQEEKDLLDKLQLILEAPKN